MIVANVLLGVNQGLTWSTTVIMKIDLVGPERRGLAMGFNEAAGYGAVALTALATGFIAARTPGCGPNRSSSASPTPRSASRCRHCSSARPTATPATKHADHDANTTATTSSSTGEVFALTTFREKALSSCSQAGLVNNLNDGLAWGLFPHLLRRRRPVGRPDRCAGRGLPGHLGSRPTRHRRAVRSHRPQVAHRRRHVRPKPSRSAAIAATTGFGPWASARCCSASAPQWCIRRCSPRSATSPTRSGALVGRRLPALARRRVRRRRHPRRHRRRHASASRVAIWAVAALTAASGLVVAVRMYETHPAMIIDRGVPT